MNFRPGSDIYIGLGCGGVLVLVVAWIMGVPLRDIAIWAVVFLVLGFLFAQIMKRRRNRKP